MRIIIRTRGILKVSILVYKIALDCVSSFQLFCCYHVLPTLSLENGEESSTSSQILYSISNMYKLHYSGKCDYHRILYAFRTLSGILRVVPRQFVCASAATSIGSSFGPYEERIKELLIRHKRSLLGNGFYGPLFYEAGKLQDFHD